jgi:hypothetical protein
MKLIDFNPGASRHPRRFAASLRDRMSLRAGVAGAAAVKAVVDTDELKQLNIQYASGNHLRF